MEDRKYPIGKFTPERITIPRSERIEIIETFPKEVAMLLRNTSPDLLQNTYREGGWNLLQLIHHCADSHMNGFIRFKLALTSNAPEIIPYNQPAWAALPDVLESSAELSVRLLEGLHGRWSILMRHMSEEQFNHSFINPENPIRTFSLDLALALYSWHCAHHLAHMNLAVNDPS